MENSLQIISDRALTSADQPVGAPVIITALRVAYDYTYNRELLFVLCENCSAQTVRSIYFDLDCTDDAGDPLGKLPGECLRGLSAAPNTAFGEESPVVLSLRGTARVALTLQKVVFADGSVWRVGDPPVEAPIEEAVVAAVTEPAQEITAPAAEVVVESAEEPAVESAPVPAEWINPPATVEGYRTAAEGLASLNDPEKAYLVKKFTALADKLEADAAEAARKAAEADRIAKLDAEYKRLAGSAPETADQWDALATDWKALGSYKDAQKRCSEASKKAKSLRTSEKRLTQKRAEEERIAAEKAAAKRKARTKVAIWLSSIALAIIAITLFVLLVAIPASRYAKYVRTTELVTEGKYTEALAILEELGDYEDCKERIKELKVALTGREDALFFSSEDYPGYTIENGTLSFDTTQYQMIGKKLIVPDYYDDQKVTAIAAGAFAKSKNLESIVLAPTVTTVGQGAFSECLLLTSFEAPGLVTLDAEAFRGCTSLKKITLADSLAAIGSNAFQGCTALTEINLPENLRRLPDSLFLGCTALKKVTFSSKLTAIGNETFGYCTSLPSLTLPETLESIGNNAFLACHSFTTLTIPENVIFMGDKAMANCINLKEVQVNGKLTKLAARTFSGCTAMTTLSLPSTLTQIGYAAFENCSALKSVRYGGTADDWAKVEILAENNLLTSDKITFGN
ncbi:MAG: leucine-rich repeat protein [Clostridia bacterium]|nr:leucine-rich repeat protein [Clostridia bacterium]